MNYTNDKNQVVFLKDTDIVLDIAGNNVAGDNTTAVETNGIASYTLVSAVSSTASANVDFLSSELSTLSERFDAEQIFNSAAVRYKGKAELKDEYRYENTTINSDKKLYGLLLSGLIANDSNANPTSKLCAGFLFKAVSDDPSKEEYDFNGIVLHPNDYIFLNKDVDAVSDVTFDDVNIIHDYDLSVSNLQTGINTLTATVSGDAGLIDQVSSISAQVITADDSLSAQVGNIYSDVISNDDSLSNKFEAHVTAYNKLCTDLSNAITATADVVSNETSGLSLSVKNLSSELLDETNGKVPELSAFATVTLSGDLSTLSTNTQTSAANLTAAIETIRADIKGGVVYQGHLKLTKWHEVHALSDYIAGMYTDYSTPIQDQIKQKELSNGWMYYIDFNPAEEIDGHIHPGITEVGSFKTNEADDSHIEFVPGNYIIVHSHNNEDITILSNLSRDKIDIIQVTDSDLVRFKDLNEVSTTLNNNINELSTDVHGTVSSAIDNKIILSTLPSNVGNGTSACISSLIINKATAQQYAELLAAGAIEDDQIYVIKDNDMSLFGNSITAVDDIQANSIHATSAYVDGLTADGTIQGQALDIVGSAGTVKVSNVEAENISAKTTLSTADLNAVDGKISNLTATGLTATNQNVSNLTATSLTATDQNVSSLTATGLTATDQNVSNLTATSLTATDQNVSSLTATSLTVEALTASQISSSTLSAAEQIVIDGKLTATADGLTADGKLSTNNDIDVAGNLSVGSNSLSAKGIYVDSNGTTTPNLTVAAISATTLTVANSIQLFNDSYGISRDEGNNALNIRTSDGSTDDPNFKINGKKFKQYYAEYLSSEYLSDGYIDEIKVSTDNNVSGIAIKWNDQIKVDGHTKSYFIPLSSLGGIYDEAGSIIKINKNDANSFKISADPAAISNEIKTALSVDFGIQDTKDELSNKIKIQNASNPPTAVTTMTIHKMTADAYRQLAPEAIIPSDIYCITDSNMDMFNSRIVNLAAPQDNADAANKTYVDSVGADATSNAIADISANMAIVKNDEDKTVELKYDGQKIAEFNYNDFIIDGFLQTVEITATSDPDPKPVLRFSWNTASGIDTTDIPLTSIAPIYSGDSDYIDINDGNDYSHKTISLNIDHVSAAIDSSIRARITSSDLAVLKGNGDWNAPAANSPLAQLSIALNTEIRKNIVATDLTSLWDLSIDGTTNSPSAPDENTPFYELSNAISVALLSAMFGKADWCDQAANAKPADNSPLAWLSSNLNTAIRADIVSSDLTSLHGDTGSWNAPAENSPLYELSSAISTAISNDIASNYVSKVALSGNGETAGILSSYETIQHVDQLVDNIKAIASAISADDIIAEPIAEGEGESGSEPGAEDPETDPYDPYSAENLPTTVSKLVNAVSALAYALSALTKQPSEE